MNIACTAKHKFHLQQELTLTRWNGWYFIGS